MNSYYQDVCKNLDPVFKTTLGKRERKGDTQGGASLVKKQKNAYYQTNFQGFPIDECEYCEEVEDWVYCPPRYNGDPECALCKDCFLRPCIKWGKMEEFMLLSMERRHDYEGDRETIKHKILEGVEIIAKEVFGSNHIDSYGIPSCLIDLLISHLDDVVDVVDSQWEAGGM